MLPQLRKITNNSGVILIIVLIILMVMGIVSISIFSQSMSQSTSSRSEVDQMVAEQLAKGAFWQSYNSTAGGDFATGAHTTAPINGRTFLINVSTDPSDSTNTRKIVNVSY